MTCSCPADSPRRSVYGTDRYRGFSDVCSAAKHADALREGTTTVYDYDDCEVFVGSTRNDIQAGHGHEPGPSFGFSETVAECPSPFDVTLGEAAAPADASCDNEYAVKEVCKHAQDGTDNPIWFGYVDEIKMDCTCPKIAQGGLGMLIPFYQSRIEVLSEEGVTPLQAAASRGHEKEVRYLLEHGASPNAGSVPPLQAAVMLKGEVVARPTIAMLLVQAGADTATIDFTGCEDGASELLSCATLETRIRQ